MKPLNRSLDTIRGLVRRVMQWVAQGLNTVTNGQLSPDMVTWIGLLAHLPIAYLIIMGHVYWSAALLVIFGLFDTLDGTLARLQHRATSAGMVLDATTDRFKEVILYAAIADRLIRIGHPYYAVWAVIACGASLSVSYVKAKGETAVKDRHLTPNEINRLFQDGLLRFEIRMFVLIVGLVSGHLEWALVIIAILASLTAIDRLFTIRQKLKSTPDV